MGTQLSRAPCCNERFKPLDGFTLPRAPFAGHLPQSPWCWGQRREEGAGPGGRREEGEGGGKRGREETALLERALWLRIYPPSTMNLQVEASARSLQPYCQASNPSNSRTRGWFGKCSSRWSHAGDNLRRSGGCPSAVLGTTEGGGGGTGRTSPLLS